MRVNLGTECFRDRQSLVERIDASVNCDDYRRWQQFIPPSLLDLWESCGPSKAKWSNGEDWRGDRCAAHDRDACHSAPRTAHEGVRG